MSTTREANSASHYMLMTVAIIIGIVGVYLRFAGDAPIWPRLANIILVIGIVVALKAVNNILK